MTPEELKEIQERTEKATPGPWRVERASFSDDGFAMFEIENVTEIQKADADFIAHARTDIPKLLDCIKYLEYQVKMHETGTIDPEAWIKLVRSTK